MKKLFTTLLGLFLAINLSLAGGLVHNTNQSAAWARMLVRDASTSIDAAYFNPAGLTKLPDGIHISVSNQSIFQSRTITNSALGETEYEGSVSAYFFPNFYAAYKTGKFAFSLAFVPIGGGGSAEYDDGAPSFDLLLNSIVPAYAALGATGLAGRNASLNGSSIYLGYQGGISFAITDMISVYAGARYVTAKNTYDISVTDIELSTADPSTNLDYATVEAIAGPDAAARLADIIIETEQTGTTFTPIVGVNLAFLEDALNFGIKYEFQSDMDVENNTTRDDAGFYPDGEKTNADIPAQLSVGVNYKISDKFSTQLGYHTYFDEGAGWSTIEGSDPEISIIDNNYQEFGIGFEYNVNEQLLFSLGYLRAQTGVNDYYHDDISYSLSSNTIGLGGAYKINDMITIELGGYNTMYVEETIDDPYGQGFSQTYQKNNLAIALGLNFMF
jgi:long-chain fatty acid transport protein